MHGHLLRLAGLEESLDLAGEVIGPLRELHILTDVTFLVHEGHIVLLGNINKGIVLADNNRDKSGVGGRNDILVLLAGEDIDGGEVALGVSVLASLGGRHGSHLAGVLLLHADVTNYKEKIGGMLISAIITIKV